MAAAGRDHECDHHAVCVTHEASFLFDVEADRTEYRVQTVQGRDKHVAPTTLPPHYAVSVPQCRVRGVEQGETSSQPYENLGSAFLSNTVSWPSSDRHWHCMSR